MKKTDRFCIIAQVLNELQTNRQYYGKIVIQKIIYFLQESQGLNFGYRFVFYHYGPYSEDLSRDIDLMELNRIVNSSIDPKGMGYSIALDNVKGSNLIKEGNIIIQRNRAIINRVMHDFGLFGPPKLELFATVHFIHKYISQKEGSSRIKEKVIKIVKKMKPKFSKTQIREQFEKLKNLGYLNY